MKMTTKNLTVAGVLSALAILFPMIMPKLEFGVFSMTLLSHAPIIIAMFISPLVAVLVEICATIGFLLRGVALVIVARAAVQILFVVIGAFMLKKHQNIILVGIVTLILHAVAEALIIIPFILGGEQALLAQMWLTFGGTAIHHVIDFIISVAIVLLLDRAKAYHFEGLSYNR